MCQGVKFFPTKLLSIFQQRQTTTNSFVLQSFRSLSQTTSNFFDTALDNMPSVSHRTDFCLVHRLKWKIVPPPAVIPPKPTRIIRFGTYRQRLDRFPRPGIAFPLSIVAGIIISNFIYFTFAKPDRERYTLLKRSFRGHTQSG